MRVRAGFVSWGVTMGALVACGSSGSALPPVADGGFDTAADAELDAGDGSATVDGGASSDTALDGSSGPVDSGPWTPPDASFTPPTCVGPLGDAGFTSLADFPVATLCASTGGMVVEGSPPCQGSILVSVPDSPGSGDLGEWWLFDAATGALEASGTNTNGLIACGGGATGFVYPYQCFEYGGWPQKTSLCTDAGSADAAVGDSSADGPG